MITSNENQGTVYDHDSYNKNSDVNYLNFDEKDRSLELFTYYKRLIELRNENKALKNSDSESIVFKVYQDPLHITFSINGDSVKSPYTYFISINCNRTESHEIILPKGNWEVLITDELVSEGVYVKTSYLVPYSSGILLRQKQ
jgi:pullulanase/glycogen debranching enzyme